MAYDRAVNRLASSVREWMPSFAYTFDRFDSTVRTVMNRRAAISLFECPAATSSAIRRCVSLSSSPRRCPAWDARELGRRLLGPERRAERVEHLQCLGQRVACRPPLLRAPLDRALCEQRPAELERLRQADVSGERALDVPLARSRSPRAAATSARPR